MIEYKEFRSELINEVYSIYEENQWKSYLGDKEKLSRAFEQSLYLLGAFEEGNLVGLRSFSLPYSRSQCFYYIKNQGKYLYIDRLRVVNNSLIN